MNRKLLNRAIAFPLIHKPIFEKHKDLGVLLLRLFVGVRLIYGVLDNILSWEKMEEFESFLTQFNFPFPLISAVVSVYAQFLAGLFILIGYKIRWAGALMIINFLIAIFMVHRGDTFEGMTPALFMIFSSLLLLFQGAGRYAVEGVIVRKP